MTGPQWANQPVEIRFAGFDTQHACTYPLGMKKPRQILGKRSISTEPDFAFEEAAIAAGKKTVAGVDEAGRGPWAGPVVAAAVILDANAIPHGLDDSKALDHRRRETLYEALVASGAAIGVGIAEADQIDRINILQATLWAMQQAVANLPRTPCLVLVDGNRLPKLAMAARAIIAGDARCLSIAAASIVAKVTRDRLMTEMAQAYPGYGFERHKGYGTAEHKAALDRLNACPQHRRSFRPVQIAIAGYPARIKDLPMPDSSLPTARLDRK